MQSGFYNTTGGIVTQFSRLELISNNLANLNTTGFKRDDVIIGDYMRLYETTKDQLPIPNHTRDAARFINRTMDRVPIIVEEYSDKSVGSIAKTDNMLDFALKGANSFFAISTPNGVRYTRDGSFNLNQNGEIINKNGFKVLSSEEAYKDNGQNSTTEDFIGIIIPSNSTIEVTPNGNVYARNVANETIGEPVLVGNIAIVSFENPRYLRKMGDNLYSFPKDRLDERTIAPQSDIAQGYIEKSNVNAVLEMTSLIETNRLVDMYSKVMKTHMDDLNNEAITKLAVRA